MPCYAFYNKEVPDHCDFVVEGTSFFEICRMWIAFKKIFPIFARISLNFLKIREEMDDYGGSCCGKQSSISRSLSE